jgi:hypothetical protein
MGQKNLSLMKNSAAAFGTDLDILHKKIYEIKKRLKSNYGLDWT